MAISENKVKDHIKGFQKEISQVSKDSKDSFFNWFNESGGDKEVSFLKGEVDFNLSITPFLLNRINPKEKIALEIGHGGGRLIAASARHFKKVIGVDIHGENELVEDELQSRGISNFQLHRTDGKTIPLDNEAVDVVYSMIVFQHLEHIDIFKSYIEECCRVLKPGGLAIIYFARLSFLSLRRKSAFLYAIDKWIEKMHPKGFKEQLAHVNSTNLRVGLPYAEKLAKNAGFKILETSISKKLSTFEKYGNQHGLILQKK